MAKFPRVFLNALFGYDFFISYAHADGTDYPEKLSRDLMKLGFQTHLDTRDYHVGADLGKLTEIRLKNSRNLVVVCRPMALEQSIWVRREIDAFEQRGQSVRLINVENAIAHSCDDPPPDTVAAWLSEPTTPQGDECRAEVLLRVEDNSDTPDHPSRIPGFNVAERLQNAFTDRRQRTRRMQVLTGILGLFVTLSIGLGVVSVFAVSAAERAQREALTARLQFSAVEAERLATTPDSVMALRKIVDDVTLARNGLGHVPASTRRALWRLLYTGRDLWTFNADTAQLVHIGWDPKRERIVTLERDGGVSAYDLDGERTELLASLAEPNPPLWFSKSGQFIQRVEEGTESVYSLNGELLLRFETGDDDAEGHELHDIASTGSRLLWADDEACLRVAPIDLLPASVTPVFCADQEKVEFASFADGYGKIFLVTGNGITRLLDATTGEVLAENDLGVVFHIWRLRDDAQAFVGFHPEKIVVLNRDLDVNFSRGLETEKDVDMAGGEVLWNEERILVISNENEQMARVFSLALEPEGPPFRLHSVTSLGVAQSIGAFISAGYIDNTVRLLSARPHGSQSLLQNRRLEFSQIAYCSGSGHLVLGDFAGSIHLFDPQSPSQLESLVLPPEEWVEGLVCLENDRWVAVADGQLFSSETFEATDLRTIDISGESASHLALFGDGVALASLAHVYILDQQTLTTDAVLGSKDALENAIPDDEDAVITSITTGEASGNLVIGVNFGTEIASLVFVTMEDREVVRAIVQQTNQMEIPESLAFSPDGKQVVVAGPMMRVEAFDEAGHSTWSVRGSDNPFLDTLAYVDDDFFLGGGFLGDISLWSRDGTVAYSGFDADLTGENISLTAGGPREVFAIVSDGTLKRLSFDVDELEALALQVLSQLPDPN
ncbi:TIR domain-containing protein [Cochlodiniinecator piscidefendens]|uniref:TIR domain-containing protein n=1 Tax=Cochlodiniinecator piscidefendens TaxID=2715756 RepID=UPI00140D6972|nr:TIR domain-containing protein [Cochlodiniinecator piscidefendens]